MTISAYDFEALALDGGLIVELTMLSHGVLTHLQPFQNQG
jgi:hypothetical protein